MECRYRKFEKIDQVLVGGPAFENSIDYSLGTHSIGILLLSVQ